METFIIKLVIAVVMALGGAIAENESNGAVTASIGYNDDNKTYYECKEIHNAE